MFTFLLGALGGAALGLYSWIRPPYLKRIYGIHFITKRERVPVEYI